MVGREDNELKSWKAPDEWVNRVEAREKRKLRARARKFRTIWFGFSMFGLVGWSVAVPGLIGTAAGVWLDANRPVSFSWTLTLMVAGIGLGALNAWRWLSKERAAIEREREDGEDA